MEIVYRLSKANSGLVFAYIDRAKEIHDINRALHEASTWGDFRRLMPEDEYNRVKTLAEEYDCEVSEYSEFHAEQVPGYADGDYPDWLQAEMDRVLPDDILEEFAVSQSTVLSGDYYHIEERALGAIVERLEKSGYRVSDGSDLDFT
jgi:hypothetical protein